MLGLFAAAASGTALAVFMYHQDVIWYYAYVVVGFVIGLGFQYRSRPDTWRVRSYLAAASTLVSLFFSQYFLTRAFAVDVLTTSGQLLPGESVPLFISPSHMYRVMADVFRANPINYFVWGLAVYIAYTLPSSAHRAAKKRAKAQAGS